MSMPRDSSPCCSVMPDGKPSGHAVEAPRLPPPAHQSGFERIPLRQETRRALLFVAPTDGERDEVGGSGFVQSVEVFADGFGVPDGSGVTDLLCPFPL